MNFQGYMQHPVIEREWWSYLTLYVSPTAPVRKSYIKNFSLQKDLSHFCFSNSLSVIELHVYPPFHYSNRNTYPSGRIFHSNHISRTFFTLNDHTFEPYITIHYSPSSVTSTLYMSQYTFLSCASCKFYSILLAVSLSLRDITLPDDAFCGAIFVVHHRNFWHTLYSCMTKIFNKWEKWPINWQRMPQKAREGFLVMHHSICWK